MEWIATPSTWIGLVMLFAIEVILGTRSTAFLDVLIAEAPAEKHPRARHLGLALGLGLRLGLLALTAWILTIAPPLFTLGGNEVSPRSLLLVVGGLFLIAKASLELHNQVGGRKVVDASTGLGGATASWQVIAQIVALNVMFSLDIIVTAVGLVEHVSVMVIAVLAATAVSTIASKPILGYLQRQPSVVVLCLAILVVVGFALFMDGLGQGVPKAYLYTVIGLVLLMEAVGHFRRQDPGEEFAGFSLRQRTAARVLKLLGRQRNKTGRVPTPVVSNPDDLEPTGDPIFAAEEADMIQGVLTLAERPVRTIMSPRAEVQWIDIDGTAEQVRVDTLRMTHSVTLLCRRQLNDFVGVAATTELLRALVEGEEGALGERIRQPVIVHESTKVLRLMGELRRSSMPMAIVLDEYGSVAGVATPNDILEAIAGEFPDRDEAPAELLAADDGSWIIEGLVDVHRVSAIIGVDIVDKSHRYTTLNGYVVWKLGDIPRAGQRFAFDGLEFEILAMKGRTTARIRVWRSQEDDIGKSFAVTV